MVIYNKDDIDAISFELKNNKTLIAPTDTIPGLLSINKNNIYKIKNRNIFKKVILFICSLDYVEKINSDFIKLANAFWPGNLTLVKNGISYRIPNDNFLINLISKTGPLYCSSANISGKEVISSYEEAKIEFNNYDLEIIFLEGKYNINKASTVYDVDKDKILREGDITYEQIKSVIKN